MNAELGEVAGQKRGKGQALLLNSMGKISSWTFGKTLFKLTFNLLWQEDPLTGIQCIRTEQPAGILPFL